LVLRWRRRWWWCLLLLLLHGGDCLHHGLHQLSLHGKNLMECLAIVKVLVWFLLVEVIAGLLTRRYGGGSPFDGCKNIIRELD
jgi:hypothetical protein